MTVVSLLLLLLVAGVCGSVGQAIAGYSRGGCLVSIALGFIGAPWECGWRARWLTRRCCAQGRRAVVSDCLVDRSNRPFMAILLRLSGGAGSRDPPPQSREEIRNLHDRRCKACD